MRSRAGDNPKADRGRGGKGSTLTLSAVRESTTLNARNAGDTVESGSKSEKLPMMSSLLADVIEEVLARKQVGKGTVSAPEETRQESLRADGQQNQTDGCNIREDQTSLLQDIRGI